jgi:hypothetical protein
MGIARSFRRRVVNVRSIILVSMPANPSRSGRAGFTRAWLAGGMIPEDRELLADLTGVEYGYVLRECRDAIILEKKEDMKRRGLASPDLADALALTFAYPVAAHDHRWQLTGKPSHCILGDPAERLKASSFNSHRTAPLARATSQTRKTPIRNAEPGKTAAALPPFSLLDVSDISPHPVVAA